MPQARARIAGASYDADTVKMLGRVFDEAWTQIAPNHTSRLAIDAARLKLANIILSFAAETYAREIGSSGHLNTQKRTGENPEMPTEVR